ncbi:MAG: helix-turn-helix transcriptional regulator [Sulfuricellaceae bacterium]
MHLRDWLTKNKVSKEDFADRIGVKPKTVGRYCLTPGKVDFRRPAADVMVRIITATGGKVTPSDFYAFPKRRAA